MAHSDHQHSQLPMHRFIDDAVLADSQPPQTGELALEDRPGERLVGKAIDRGHQTPAILR